MGDYQDRDRWVAIECGFLTNPKILRVGAAGAYAHLAAITYAAEHRTNGYVPAEAVWRILHLDPLIAEAADDGLEASMVQAKLWHPVSGGYEVHDYLKHQSNAETMREKRARAGRAGGLASAKQRASKVKQSKLEAEAEAETEAEQNRTTPAPAPTPEAREPARAKQQTPKAGAGAGAGDLEKLNPHTELERVLNE